MKYSIIIPAYNVETTIEESLLSAIHQKYQDFETIVVNDGSTDKTKSILDKYSRMEKVIVIHKENKGVSAARNDGINYSTGQYIVFLDADDLLPDYLLETIDNYLKELEYQPDIIFGGYTRFDVNGEKPYFFNFSQNIEDIRGYMIWKELYGRKKQFVSPIMAQIYRAETLKTHRIYFDQHFFISEDHDWRFSLFIKTERYGYINKILYKYRTDNISSVTHSSMSLKKYVNKHDFIIKWKNIANERIDNADIKKIILKVISQEYANSAIFINDIDNELEKEKAIELFKKDSYILRYSTKWKYKISYLIYRILGTDFYFKAIRRWHFKR